MTKIKNVQASFSGGEVDRNFEGRVDLETYAKSARQLRNCYIDNIGFAFRREGSEYIGNTTSEAAGRLVSFEFNTEQQYLLVFTPGEFKVYTDDTVTATITSSPISGLTAAQIDEMDFTQSADTLILVHPDFQPIEITRTSDSAWTAANISFDNIPQFTYFDTVGSGTDEVMSLKSTLSGTAGSFRLRLEGELSDSIRFGSGDTNLQRATRIEDALRNLKRTSDTGITVVANGAQDFDITFGGDDGDRDWITPEIEDRTGFDALSITSTTQGEPAQEDVWSSARGWPKTITFFEGRLWFGGSGSRPQTFWASIVGEFFNFNVGTGLDDEALDITIDDDQVNAITGVSAGRTMQFFTTGGEFAVVRTTLNEPITPTNIRVRKQTQHGARDNLRPVSIDGSTIFVEGSGNVVREFVFQDVEESFTAPNLSVLSTEVIRGVKRMAVRRSTSDASVSYTFMINDDDGTMAVLNRLKEQQLTAFTLFETEGTYEDVTVVGTDVYTIVKRSIDSSDVRFIEKFNRSNLLDASVISTEVTATDTHTGFDHLDDEEIRIMAALTDGQLLSPLGNETPSSGSVTVDEEVEVVEGGLMFAMTCETLPVEGLLGQAQTFGEFKRLVDTFIRVEDSRFFTVTAGRVKYKPAFRNFGSSVLDQPAPLFSDTKRVFLAGVERNSTITISQDDPFELKVLALTVGYAL